MTEKHVTARELAGDKILAAAGPGARQPATHRRAESDLAAGWFAARPSGTEPKFKLYAESTVGPQHLDALLADARRIVESSLEAVARQ